MGEFFQAALDERARQRKLKLAEDQFKFDKEVQSGVEKVRQARLKKLGLETEAALDALGQMAEERQAQKQFKGRTLERLNDLRVAKGLQEVPNEVGMIEQDAQLPTGQFPPLTDEDLLEIEGDPSLGVLNEPGVEEPTGGLNDPFTEQLAKLNPQTLDFLTRAIEETPAGQVPQVLKRFGIELGTTKEAGSGINPSDVSTIGFRQFVFSKTAEEGQPMTVVELAQADPGKLAKLDKEFNDMTFAQQLKISQDRNLSSARIRKESALAGPVNVFEQLVDIVTIDDPEQSLFLPKEEVEGARGLWNHLTQSISMAGQQVRGTNEALKQLDTIRRAFRASIARLMGDVGNLARAEQENALFLVPNAVGSLWPPRLADTQEAANMKVRMMGEFLLAQLQMVDSGHTKVIEGTLSDLERFEKRQQGESFIERRDLEAARRAVAKMEEAGILDPGTASEIRGMTDKKALTQKQKSLVQQAAGLEAQKRAKEQRLREDPRIQKADELGQKFRQAVSPAQQVKARQEISDFLRTEGYADKDVLRALSLLENQTNGN